MGGGNLPPGCCLVAPCLHFELLPTTCQDPCLFEAGQRAVALRCAPAPLGFVWSQPLPLFPRDQLLETILKPWLGLGYPGWVMQWEAKGAWFHQLIISQGSLFCFALGRTCQVALNLRSTAHWCSETSGKDLGLTIKTTRYLLSSPCPPESLLWDRITKLGEKTQSQYYLWSFFWAYDHGLNGFTVVPQQRSNHRTKR